MARNDFWDKLKNRLVDVSNAAADFTEEQAVVGKLKFDILNLNRKIDRNKLEIGSRVLDLSRTGDPENPLNDSEIRKRIAAIGELEAQIGFKRSEISREVEEIRSRRRPAAAKTPAGNSGPAASKPAPVIKKSAPAKTKPASPPKKPANKPVPKAVKKPG